MPVAGLMPGLMELGKIKIGIKGKEVVSKDGNSFRLPQKINHFRIVKNDRDENDDYILDEHTIEKIKNNPATIYNKDMNIIGIPIRVLYNQIDMVFPTQYVSYVNSRLSCSGNGITAITRDGRETKCPCPRLENTYAGKDKCKISGVLSCIVEGSNVGGCFKFRTTSINSARYILSSLMLIKAATGGLLSFIPLRLVINPKKTIIPSTGQPTTIHVVTVEFQGGIEKLQQKALEMGKERVSLIENMRDIEIEAKNIIQSVDIEQEEKEIAEEFFPDSIDLKKEAKEPFVRPTKEDFSGLGPMQLAGDEKSEITEKKTDAKEVRVEADETQNKTFDTSKKDDLLGFPARSGKKTPAVTVKSTVKESTATAGKKLDPKKPIETEEPTVPTKIKKEQLKAMLDLKVNILKINDKEVWDKMVEHMKFPGVKKANDMTSQQGDAFIQYLKEFKGVPF